MTEGESPRGYITRSKIAFHEADFNSMTEDDYRTLYVITAMKDPELRKDLLKIKNINVAKVCVNTYEEAKAADSGMTGDTGKARNNWRGGGKGANAGGIGRGFNNGTNGMPGVQRRISYCNCCNKANHLAYEFWSVEKLVCSDCPSGTVKGHLNKMSGKCPLNLTGYTIPPIEAPSTAGQQNRGTYAGTDTARSTNAMTTYGAGNNMP